VLEWIARRHEHPLQLGRWPMPMRWTVYTALVWGTLSLAPAETGRFIYFQF